jgi:hypothetical protein
MTPLDFSSSPFFPSQRGDSGKNNIPKNCNVDGTADRPNISLQLGLIKNKSITENSYPPVINKVFIVITLPLISIGATSDK